MWPCGEDCCNTGSSIVMERRLRRISKSGVVAPLRGKASWDEPPANVWGALFCGCTAVLFCCLQAMRCNSPLALAGAGFQARRRWGVWLEEGRCEVGSATREGAILLLGLLCTPCRVPLHRIGSLSEGCK